MVTGERFILTQVVLLDINLVLRASICCRDADMLAGIIILSFCTGGGDELTVMLGLVVELMLSAVICLLDALIGEGV